MEPLVPPAVSLAVVMTTAPAIPGMSAVTSARNVGLAAAPVVGPAHTRLAFWVALSRASEPAGLATFHARVSSAGTVGTVAGRSEFTRARNVGSALGATGGPAWT